jgi:hypothetical protein
MTNYARLDHAEKRIVMDRTFAKNAGIIGSPEYDLLQECRKAYPNYQVVRREIKKKEGQNRYAGLTVDAMREHIERHEPEATKSYMLEKFDTLLVDMECISKGHTYPRVKSWFLKNYPEVKLTGKLVEDRHQDPQQNQLVSIDTAA